MSLQCPSCDEKCARRKKLEDHITGVHGGPERILLNFNNWEGKSNYCDLVGVFMRSPHIISSWLINRGIAIVSTVFYLRTRIILDQRDPCHTGEWVLSSPLSVSTLIVPCIGWIPSPQSPIHRDILLPAAILQFPNDKRDSTSSSGFFVVFLAALPFIGRRKKF